MSLLRRYARPALVVVLLAACVLALVSSWGDVTEAMPRVGIARFSLSIVAAIAAGIALAYGWRMLVIDIAPAELSRPLGHTESVAVFSASQLGKYIPGSVWP